MGFLDDIRDIGGTVISNVIDPGGIGRTVIAEASKTAAGLFNDATAPFLAPLQNIMKTLEPGFRFDFGDINARLSVATRSEFVFPQLPGFSREGGGGDLTGGLLSDLAFDSEALRKAENDLAFLASALRRGVYPHRDDAFFLGLSLVPKLTGAMPNVKFDGQVWARAHITNTSDGGTEADVTVGMRDVEINERIDSIKARLGGSGAGTAEIVTALERSSIVQLRTQRGRRNFFKVEITLQDVGGAVLNNFGAFFREISVWIERRNAGYTDVLHSFVWRDPSGDKLTLMFPVERIEFISDNEDNKMQTVGRAGGGLAGAADAIDQALAAIQTPAQAPDEKAKGMERLQEILARRVGRAEVVREHLWNARRRIVRLQAPANVFDYRFRYKIRLENTINAKRTIAHLRMRSTGVPNADFDLGRFEMPPQSRFDMTVYPLRQDPNTTNEASIELADSKSNFTMALVAGLGLAESVVRSVFPAGAGQPVDTAKLEWTVSDTAAIQ